MHEVRMAALQIEPGPESVAESRPQAAGPIVGAKTDNTNQMIGSPIVAAGRGDMNIQ